MAQKVPIGKRKGNIKNTSVIPRPVTPVTGRGNPFLFLDSSIFPRGVKENGLPRRFAPRNDRGLLYVAFSFSNRQSLYTGDVALRIAPLYQKRQVQRIRIERQDNYSHKECQRANQPSGIV